MNCIQFAKVFYYDPLYYNRNTLSLNPPEKPLPPPLPSPQCPLLSRSNSALNLAFSGG